MFFILSKILLFFTYPLIWILTLLILAYIFRKKKIKRNLLISALATFFFFSNGFILCEVLKHWEGENKKLSKEKYDGVIILGGYSSWNTQRTDISFNEGSDRFIKGFELYQAGKAKKIILSGGSGLILKPEEKESGLIKKLLLEMGVSNENILLENNSRNTYENAIFTEDLIREKGIEDGHFILITSAFHMKRAKKCFEKTGLKIECLKVDFKVDDDDYTLSTYLMPSAITLEMWQILIKEWIGYLAYSLKGYF